MFIPKKRVISVHCAEFCNNSYDLGLHTGGPASAEATIRSLLRKRPAGWPCLKTQHLVHFELIHPFLPLPSASLLPASELEWAYGTHAGGERRDGGEAHTPAAMFSMWEMSARERSASRWRVSGLY